MIMTEYIRPDYYQGKVECIDAIISSQGAEAAYWFCKCNAIKYLWRSEGKNGLEDLKKAEWYIRKAVELKGAEHE